jgi:hypothetical protein
MSSAAAFRYGLGSSAARALPITERAKTNGAQPTRNLRVEFITNLLLKLASPTDPVCAIIVEW